jgi:hypothetical protein
MSLKPIESSIRTEASRNSKLATDIDNFRNRYIDVDTENNIEVKFPAFDILTFDRNFFILLNSSEEVAFRSRWYMRPDYVSFDYYNTTIYWPLILYVNNVSSREDFVDFETILVPPYTSIFQLFSDRQVDKNIIPLKETVLSDTKINQYYKKYPLDKMEMERLDAEKQLLGFGQPQILGIYNTEKTEIKILTSTDLANKYVDLLREPSNPSGISIKLNNFSIQQKYNYDYTLVYNSQAKHQRISWKTSDIIANSENSSLLSNMATQLRVGSRLTITYPVSITYRIADGIPSV